MFRELLMGATGQKVEIVNKKNKKEMKWVRAVDPFVTIASICMKVFRTKFIEEEWKVKVEGRQAWIPARMIDQKLNILLQNQWILESQLKNESVSEKEFVCMPIAKIPPSGYNGQYSKRQYNG